MWVERLGGLQVTVASAFGVSPAAATMILSNLRKKGLTKEEEMLIDKEFKTIVEVDNDIGKETAFEKAKPKVIVLKRQR